jgi:hypothetical protein
MARGGEAGKGTPAPSHVKVAGPRRVVGSAASWGQLNKVHLLELASIYSKGKTNEERHLVDLRIIGTLGLCNKMVSRKSLVGQPFLPLLHLTGYCLLI